MERVGGRNRLKERDREESEAVGSFFPRFLSLWLSGAFPLLEKLSLFLPLSFPPPPFFPDSVCCLSQLISLTVCKQSSAFSVFCLHQFLWSLSLSGFSGALSLYDFRFPSLHSLFPSYFPSLSPPFFRWPPLSAFLLPSSSGTVLPGCISSRRASPKRY